MDVRCSIPHLWKPTARLNCTRTEIYPIIRHWVTVIIVFTARKRRLRFEPTSLHKMTGIHERANGARPGFRVCQNHIQIVNTRSNDKIYDVQRADDVGNIAADLLSFPILRSVFRQRPLEMKTWR